MPSYDRKSSVVLRHVLVPTSRYDTEMLSELLFNGELHLFVGESNQSIQKEGTCTWYM